MVKVDPEPPAHGARHIFEVGDAVVDRDGWRDGVDLDRDQTLRVSQASPAGTPGTCPWGV